MKRYVNLVAATILFCSGLAGTSPSTNPVRVRPINADEYAIVNAIKGRSDITQQDVDRIKLLSISYPSMTALLAGHLDWNRCNLYNLNFVLEHVPTCFAVAASFISHTYLRPSDKLASMGSLLMAGVVGLGTRIVGSKLIYPRLRCGNLYKVQRFIDVCEGLVPETRVAGHHVSIAHVSFKDKDALFRNLPDGWMVGTKAVINALTNLVEQGTGAIALLNQIGVDVDCEHVEVSFYLVNLEHNLRLLTEKKDDKK